MAHDKVEITVNKLATTVAKLDKVGFSGTDWKFTFTAMQGHSFKYSDGKYGLVFSEKETGACNARIVDEPFTVTVEAGEAYAAGLAQFIGRPIRVTVDFSAKGTPVKLASFEVGNC